MKCKYLVSLLLLLLLVNSLLGSDSEGVTEIEGYLVCRYCGADATILNLIDNSIISPYSLSNKNITINNKSILVQELKNPAGIIFQVIVTRRANCAKSKDWFAYSTWFENYSWKFCICTHCKDHIGWMFEPTETALESTIFPSSEGFYVLILEKVVSELYVNSLLMFNN